MRDYRQRFGLILLLAAALAALAASCGDQGLLSPGGSHETTSRSACPEGEGCIEELRACPDGEVGWRFKKKLYKTSQEYRSRAGDLAEEVILRRHTVHVTEAECGFGSLGVSVEEITKAYRADCRSDVECTLRNNDYCSHLGLDSEVSYTCGPEGGEREGVEERQVVVSAGEELAIECEQPEPPAYEHDRTVACIPRQCHGRARRNLDMECVEDATKRETVVRARIVEPLRAVYKTQTDKNLERYDSGYFYRSEDPEDQLYPNMPYEMEIEVDIGGVVPEAVTFTGWISDRYISRGVTEFGRDYEDYPDVHGYRCVAFKFDIGEDDGFTLPQDGVSGDRAYRRYRKKLTVVLSEECIEGHKLSRQNAAREAGTFASDGTPSVSSFEGYPHLYIYAGSDLHLSYDMEGRTVWHKGLSPNSDGEAIARHEPECAPNPVDFFYDSSTQTYKTREYYAQRELALGGSNNEQYFFDWGGARRAEIGFDDLVPRDKLVIRTASEMKPAVRVDMSWHAVNLWEGHDFNPFYRPDKALYFSEKWQGPGGGKPSYGGRNYKDYHYAPPDPRVRFRFTNLFGADPVGPWIESEDFALEEGVPLGKTDAFTLEVDDELAQALIEEVGEDVDQELFILWACPDLPTMGWNIEPGAGARPDNFPELDPNSGDWRLPGSWDSMADALSFKNTGPNASSNRWCTSAAIVVEIDHFSTPVEPISSTGFVGSQSQKKSGDSTMSGGTGNDSQVTCEDRTQTHCTEVMKAGGRSDGEAGSSYFDLEVRSERNPGDEDFSGMVTGSMFGFEMLSAGDPEASTNLDSPVNVSVTDSSATITLAPPWETIADSLNAGLQNPSVEWQTGNYPDEAGLGIGWGRQTNLLVGPVPVEVSIMATVGASVSADLTFKWEPDDDQAYPCSNTDQRCLVVYDDPVSFPQAAENCSKMGGRLAELSSPTEALQVDLELSSGAMWIGAQLAYRHPDKQCATAYNAQKCQPDSKTEYRWLSNSKAFASNTGTDAPDYHSANFFTANANGLSTRYPDDAAIYYDSNKNFGVAKLDRPLPYMCVYEPAPKQDFLEWSVALNLGAAAGLNMQGCAPSSTVGGCLSGQFNIIGLTISPTLTNTFHWLYGAGADAPYGRYGATSFSVPWALKLFSGSISFSVELLFISLSTTVASYDGITVDEGSLYDWTIPTMEDF